MRGLIRKCKSLTSKPFGVNFLLLSGGNDFMAMAELIVEEGVKVVETAGRPHPPELLKLLKDAGVTIIHKCVDVRHALAVERNGVDIVEMAGLDLGGHPGEKDVGNWILLAAAGKKLSVPWIAAGGTATGSQLAAALTLGASGVNMGTRFMATQECEIDPTIKQAIVKGTEHDTELLMRGYNTLRVFKNSAAKEAKQLELEGATKSDRYRELLQDNPDGKTRQALQGAVPEDSAVWSAGQSMALITDIPSCAELLQRMVAEAADVLDRSSAMVSRL